MRITLKLFVSLAPHLPPGAKGNQIDLDIDEKEVPYLSIPLHTVIKLRPRVYGCDEDRYKLMIEDVH